MNISGHTKATESMYHGDQGCTNLQPSYQHTVVCRSCVTNQFAIIHHHFMSRRLCDAVWTVDAPHGDKTWRVLISSVVNEGELKKRILITEITYVNDHNRMWNTSYYIILYRTYAVTKCLVKLGSFHIYDTIYCAEMKS